MRFMFLLPLIGGCLFYYMIYIFHIKITRISFNLYNSGIAILVSGCLVRGIITISGRSSLYDWYYWIIGGLFIVISVVLNIILIKK